MLYDSPTAFSASITLFILATIQFGWNHLTTFKKANGYYSFWRSDNIVDRLGEDVLSWNFVCWVFLLPCKQREKKKLLLFFALKAFCVTHTLIMCIVNPSLTRKCAVKCFASQNMSQSISYRDCETEAYLSFIVFCGEVSKYSRKPQHISIKTRKCIDEAVLRKHRDTFWSEKRPFICCTDSVFI